MCGPSRWARSSVVENTVEVPPIHGSNPGCCICATSLCNGSADGFQVAKRSSAGEVPAPARLRWLPFLGRSQWERLSHWSSVFFTMCGPKQMQNILAWLIMETLFCPGFFLFIWTFLCSLKQTILNKRVYPLHSVYASSKTLSYIRQSILHKKQYSFREYFSPITSI
jgi:hypothetical protein